MSLQNTSLRYGSVAKFFHWTISMLVITMLFIGYFMDDIKDKEIMGQVINLHKLIGLSILVLMLLRLAWTLKNPKPLLLTATRWERIAERSVHDLFYVILIAMPLAGWIMSVAAGHVPHFFSWNISLPITQDKATAELAKTIHNTLALILIALISLHVLAALFHHWIKKDDVLRRMLPDY